MNQCARFFADFIVSTLTRVCILVASGIHNTGGATSGKSSLFVSIENLAIFMLYTVSRKKRGSTFVIITLEKHTRFL